MKKLHATYEYRGVQFTCAEEISDDTLKLGIDMLIVIRNAIDNMLMALDQVSGDFKVKVAVTKDSPSQNVSGLQHQSHSCMMYLVTVVNHSRPEAEYMPTMLKPWERTNRSTL